MLVLTRQRDESIIIRDTLNNNEELMTIRVADIRGDRVRIAIDAPKHIRIDRNEIDQARCRQHALAGGLSR